MNSHELRSGGASSTLQQRPPKDELCIKNTNFKEPKKVGEITVKSKYKIPQISNINYSARFDTGTKALQSDALSRNT